MLAKVLERDLLEAEAKKYKSVAQRERELREKETKIWESKWKLEMRKNDINEFEIEDERG